MAKVLIERETLVHWQEVMEALTKEHRRRGNDGLCVLSKQVRDDLRRINGPLPQVVEGAQ